jgi:hypothetical protein
MMSCNLRISRCQINRRLRMSKRAAKEARSTGLESALAKLAKRVSDSVPRSDGGILVRCSDTEEEFSVESLGYSPKVSKLKSSRPPVVQVVGPASRIKEVLDGKLGPGQAIAKGGIRVRGDLNYLESVLRDLGLLECE